MPPLQEPADTLQSTGDAWLGIVIPGIILLISIGVSVFLYRHFLRKRSSRP